MNILSCTASPTSYETPGTTDETLWTDETAPGLDAYRISKTIAEKAANGPSGFFSGTASIEGNSMVGWFIQRPFPIGGGGPLLLSCAARKSLESGGALSAH